MKKTDSIIKTTKSLFRCLLLTDVQRYNLYYRIRLILTFHPNSNGDVYEPPKKKTQKRPRDTNAKGTKRSASWYCFFSLESRYAYTKGHDQVSSLWIMGTRRVLRCRYIGMHVIMYTGYVCKVRQTNAQFV